MQGKILYIQVNWTYFFQILFFTGQMIQILETLRKIAF